MSPRIHTAHTLTPERPSLIRYGYRIANTANARYRIVSLGLSSASPAKTVSLPDTWKAFDRGLRGPSWRARNAGIEYGEELDGLAFESHALPGVLLLRIGTRLITEPAENGAVSGDAGSRGVRHERGGAILSLPTMGPAISMGSRRYGVAMETAWRRVATHYAAEFARYAHPHASELVLVPLMLAADACDGRDDGLATGLILRAISLLPVADPWCSELSAGLHICAEALLSRASSTDVVE